MAKKISNEVLASIKRLSEQGKGVVEISKSLGISQPTVSKYMKTLGFKTDMSAEGKKDEIVRLYKQGKLIIEIAEIVGLSRRTVRKYLQQEGLTKKAEELRFGDELETRICERYKQVKNMNIVAREFNASSTGIRKVLLRNGIQLREINKREINDEPFRNIKTELTDHVIKFLEKVPKRTSNKYKKAVEMFSEINTEEKAYWLGYIYSDGGVYIYQNLNAKLYFGVRESDKDILEKFCKFIGISDESIRFVPRKINGKVYNSYALDVPSIPLCQVLIRLGILPNKSLNLAPPDESIVPDELVTHFIRGYFDGDGGINKDGSISITGTLDMVEWITKKLNLSTKRKLVQKDLNKNTFTLRISGREAKEILNKLYANCEVALDRKLNTYKSLCGFSQ